MPCGNHFNNVCMDVANTPLCKQDEIY